MEVDKGQVKGKWCLLVDKLEVECHAFELDKGVIMTVAVAGRRQVLV